MGGDNLTGTTAPCAGPALGADRAGPAPIAPGKPTTAAVKISDSKWRFTSWSPDPHVAFGGVSLSLSVSRSSLIDVVHLLFYDQHNRKN